MTKEYRYGDIVHVAAVVESGVNENGEILVRVGGNYCVPVHIGSVLAHKPGPIRVGETVRHKNATVPADWVVCHIDGEMAMIKRGRGIGDDAEEWRLEPLHAIKRAD